MDSFVKFLSSNATPGQYADPVASVVWSLIYIILIFTGISIAVIAMNWR